MKLKPGASENPNKTVTADAASENAAAKTSETRAQNVCEDDGWCDGDGTWEEWRYLKNTSMAARYGMGNTAGILEECI